MNQHYFDVPFAFSGDKTSIPDPLQVGGTVSFTEGWNYNYQRNLATDPAALPIDRSTMNWLFNSITVALQALQQSGVPEWIKAADNGGTAFPYGKGAVVLYSASGTAPFTKYVSLINTNTDTPGATANWQVVADAIATSGQAATGTDNATIMTPLLVAQQDALRALLAGNSSQVFNVGPATAATHAPQLQQLGHGQCRLLQASTTQLKLVQRNGRNLIINGVPQQVPNTGVTVSNSGLAASTLYYVYAYMVGTTMTLEVVTTGHSTNTDGVEIKTGDATRTLVGMVWTDASVLFQDSPALRHVGSYFNRRIRSAVVSAPSAYGFSTTSFAEITPNMQVSIVAWADENIDASFDGNLYNSTTGALTSLNLYADGAAFGGLSEVAIPGTAIDHVPAHSASSVPLSEGRHLFSPYGKVSSGSAAVQNSWITRAQTAI